MAFRGWQRGVDCDAFAGGIVNGLRQAVAIKVASELVSPGSCPGSVLGIWRGSRPHGMGHSEPCPTGGSHFTGEEEGCAAVGGRACVDEPDRDDTPILGPDVDGPKRER